MIFELFFIVKITQSYDVQDSCTTLHLPVR